MTVVGKTVGQYAAGDAAAGMDTWASGAFGPGYRVALERALPRRFRAPP